MHNASLATYLNDHLAGSVAALELIDHLIDDSQDPVDAQFFHALRDDIKADQDVLRDLIARGGVEESDVRKTAAWLAEKVGWAKMKLDGPAGAGMRQLQALEGLVLGITGKRALWQALAATGQVTPGVDIGELTRRAEAQRDAVEERRVRAACAAFGN